ncbi:hypothetical protein [Coralloluteibacterium stylophorae]|uniref:DUF3574 domain-containing protein n=1 Tax=Coralloluteibacterium stylophorae TaxID=1776034 RepID=A0A8J7VRG4_9GAMM|nr:hypothetical protein [Coralloluteibacterium stylophorae]MBS7457443.1 hypothetical protein [Coralloluteibacterium stylophorae]
MPRLLPILLAACLVLPLGGCPATSTRQQTVDQALYTYAGMIRWGEFEGAWEYVDPEVREAQPLSDIDIERYKQLQVTGYHPKTSAPTADGGLVRTVEIALVNRHTQVERTVQVVETWRWDEDAQRFWLTSGLPTFER